MANFLEMSRETSANVMSQEGFQDLISQTFGSIHQILSKSLGPLGSTTTILDGQYTSATKDGFTIFKNLKFTNRYKSMIYNLIKAPCTKLNNTVGDGTTTAVVLTHHMFEQYQKSKDIICKSYNLPREMTAAWDSVVQTLVDKVKEYATPVSSTETIRDIALIAANGNREIADNIYEIYSKSKSPVIKLKSSPTNKSYVESVPGFDFPANLIDDAYVKNEDLSTVEKNMRVLVFDCKIDSEIFHKIIRPLNDIFRSNDYKLLIVAPAYDEILAKTELLNYVKHEYRESGGQFNLYLTQYRYGKLDEHQLEDFAAVLGCKVMTSDKAKIFAQFNSDQDDVFLYDYITGDSEIEPGDEREHIGLAPKVQLTIYNGSLFSDFDLTSNQIYKWQLDRAMKDLSNLMDHTDADKKNYSFEISKANARIAQLQMESYIYYIGADSSLQANVIYDTVDDVVKAVRSAVRHGIVPGSQLSIFQACHECLRKQDWATKNNKELYSELEVLIIELILKAVTELYRDVVDGPDRSVLTKHGLTFDEVLSVSVNSNKVFDLETMDHSGKVITSTETDVNILLAAADLIKLLISGNQCVFIDTVLNSAEEVDI